MTLVPAPRNPFRTFRRFWWTALAAGLAAFLYHRRPFAPPASDTFPIVEFSLAARPDGWFCPDPARLPRAAVLEAVDGDTLRVSWEGKPVFLRYYGVDTPEHGEPCYDEAAARNRSLAGAAVRLAFDARARDRYGRILAYVFTDDGRSIDAQLVSEGWGRAWKRDGRFAGPLTEMEERARASRAGCYWTHPRARGPKRGRRRREAAG